MSKFIVNVSTNWCGMDNSYRVECDPIDIDNIASDLAVENFYSYDLELSVAEEEGLDPDEMSLAEWEDFQSFYNIWDYISYDYDEVESFDEYMDLPLV